MTGSKMSVMHVYYSKLELVKPSAGSYYVKFYFAGRRYRYFSATVLGKSIFPNALVGVERERLAQAMFFEFQTALASGWSPNQQSEATLLEVVSNLKLKSDDFSPKYFKELIGTVNRFTAHLRRNKLSQVKVKEAQSQLFKTYLETSTTTVSTFNHERRRLSSLIGRILPEDVSNPMGRIPCKKEKHTLHKPFSDVGGVLRDVQTFNDNLFICCLLTYGCLLRPHKEIRLLTWGDFSSDLSYISLEGKRNKSGRNRIVPVAPQIRSLLNKGEADQNIFSGGKPYNKFYFQLLWRRYAQQTNILEPNQTLYSFRHTGAINVYNRFRSVEKVRAVMGHQSINTTLRYLRGLEIETLKQEEMPVIEL